MNEAGTGDDRHGCYRLIGTDHSDGNVEIFESTEHASSGWGPNMQHGGPVAALLARAMEQHVRPHCRISRVTVEILSAVPICDVRVRSWIARPGRRIELLQAEMSAPDPDGRWRPVATASGWQLATRPTSHVAHHADAGVPLPEFSIDSSTDLLAAWRVGFVNALDWHVTGPIGQPGVPTMAWLRLAQPIVEGEEPSELQRVMSIADVANGVGARLDPQSWTFLNTDLSVHLFEPPVGEWFGLQAETSVGHDGIALSSAVIHSADGPIGRVAQNVLVQERALSSG